MEMARLPYYFAALHPEYDFGGRPIGLGWSYTTTVIYR